MRRILLIFIVFIFLADSACAAYLLDGNDWKKLDGFSDVMAKSHKLLLVRGIYDGIGFVGDKAARYMYTLDHGDLDFGLVVNGLNHFYSDYRNIKIPIVQAISIIMLELKGEDPKKIEGVKRGLRENTIE